MNPLSKLNVTGNKDLELALQQILYTLGLPFAPGRVFFAVPSTDPSYNDIYQRFQGKYEDDSADVVQPSIEAAYAKMVTNRNDIVLVSNSVQHDLTAMLDVSKSRCHFIGMDFDSRQFGQGAKISLAVAAGATNVFTMKNTGIRNSFKNIKFINGNTVAEGLYCVGEGGEYAKYENVEIYKSTDLDETDAAELVLNGDSAQFKHCTIGSLADAVAGSGIVHPAVELTKDVVGSGKVVRDCMFEDTLFWRQAAHVNNVFMRTTNASDIERLLLLKHCGFINSRAAAALPDVAIKLGATLTVGNIVLDPLCYASRVTKVATGTGVIVTGAAPNSGTGIGVNAA